MVSFSMSASVRLRKSAFRWWGATPNFLPACKCLIPQSYLPKDFGVNAKTSIESVAPVLLLLVGKVRFWIEAFDFQSEAQSHLAQDFLDFVEGLPSEILGLEHLSFALLYELTD